MIKVNKYIKAQTPASLSCIKKVTKDSQGDATHIYVTNPADVHAAANGQPSVDHSQDTA